MPGNELMVSAGEFINPYTFIPILKEEPDRYARKPEEEIETGLTGVIDCTLSIESPTFIPNTTKKLTIEVQVTDTTGNTRTVQHPIEEFYSYEDLSVIENPDELNVPKQPIIPGSELRGMLREVYEQLTNSCFLEVDENNLPYKRTPLPKTAALLKKERDGWHLWKKVLNGKTAPVDTIRIFCRDKYAAIDDGAGGWFTKMEFVRYDADAQCNYYRYRANRNDQYKEFKDGDPAFMKINSDGKAIGISASRTSPIDRAITINSKNTLWYEKTGSKYLYMHDEYAWGDTVYLMIRNGRAEDITKDINKPGFSRMPYRLHMVPTMPTKKYFLAYRFDKDFFAGFQDCGCLFENDIERFKRVIDSYCNDKINIIGKREDKIKFYKQYKDMFEAGKTLLVYFNSEYGVTAGTHIYLSPSCMTKEYFDNKISGQSDVKPTILQKQYKHDKCLETDKLCPACRLFGMIGKTEGSAGKLRVCDTYEAKNISYLNDYTEPITGSHPFPNGKIVLPILGTPRVSATEFYLQQPDNAKMWNFDYWVEDYVRRINRVMYPTVLHYDMPLINGRKVYWQGGFSYADSERDKMNCTVRPICQGFFKFRVYFEDITETELEQLTFCLNLYGKGRHRIGKGKPIGMGVVKIETDTITLRTYKKNQNGDITIDFTVPKLSGQLPKIKDTEGNIIDTAAQILEYTTPLSESERHAVSYPKIDGKIFAWFGKNRGTTVNEPTIINTLPLIGSGKKTLPRNPADGLSPTPRPTRPASDLNQPALNTARTAPRSTQQTSRNAIQSPRSHVSVESSGANRTENICSDSGNANKPRFVINLNQNVVNKTNEIPARPKKNVINTILSKYNTLPLTQESADILIGFVRSVKETDADYAKWKDLISRAKKCLNKYNYKYN